MCLCMRVGIPIVVASCVLGNALQQGSGEETGGQGSAMERNGGRSKENEKPTMLVHQLDNWRRFGTLVTCAIRRQTVQLDSEAIDDTQPHRITLHLLAATAAAAALLAKALFARV